MGALADTCSGTLELVAGTILRRSELSQVSAAHIFMTNPLVRIQRPFSAPSRPLAPESLWKRYSASHQLAYAFADQQAAQEGAAEIIPEHLLRGMLRLTSAQSNGVRLIEEMGVTPEQVDARLPQGAAAVVWPPQPVAGGANNAPRSLSVAAQAVARESQLSADAMGHDRIGTEHLLIALLASTDSAISQALVPCGVTQTACRERLGAWLVNGTYTREPTGAAAQTPVASSGQLIQTVFAVRRYASIIYMIWVLGIWIARLVVQGSSATGWAHCTRLLSTLCCTSSFRISCPPMV